MCCVGRRSFNASNYLLAMSEFLRAANASVNARRLPGTASVRCVIMFCCFFDLLSVPCSTNFGVSITFIVFHTAK